MAQQILSSRSWGSMPSLLSGFITIVGGVHITNMQYLALIMDRIEKGLVVRGLLMGGLVMRGIMERNLIDQGNTERSLNMTSLDTTIMTRK
jgi:hypothetical protein